MNSIFVLPKSGAELESANQGTADARYRQVVPLRDISGDNFTNGTIQWRVETAGTTWIIPQLSHFRIRGSFTVVPENGQAPVPPTNDWCGAPTMDLAPCLFKYFDIRLGGKSIQKISERLAQVDVLHNRMKKPKTWLDSIGKETNYWSPYQIERQQAVTQGGYSCQNHYRPSPSNCTYEIEQDQTQAGHAGGTVTWVQGTQTLTFGGGVDLRTPQQYLGPGDIVTIDGTHVYQITSPPVSATGTFALPLATIADQGPDPYTVQKMQHKTCNQAMQKSNFELIWKPPMGWFELPHAIPPGGSWIFETYGQPESSWRQRLVESAFNSTNIVPIPQGQAQAQNLRGQYDFRIDDMYFYVYTVESIRMDNGWWFMDVPKIRCQLIALPQNVQNLIQKNFDVSSKANALTLALQDRSAGIDPKFSVTKFKIRPTSNNPEGQELLLNRWYINYNHIQKPQPDFDGQYLQNQDGGNLAVGGTNQVTQRYVETQFQIGAWSSEGGGESFAEWKERGPYYFFNWPKDAYENNTRVNILLQAVEQFDQEGHNMLLFDHWRTAFRIQHTNGRVDEIDIEEL